MNTEHTRIGNYRDLWADRSNVLLLLQPKITDDQISKHKNTYTNWHTHTERKRKSTKESGSAWAGAGEESELAIGSRTPMRFLGLVWGVLLVSTTNLRDPWGCRGNLKLMQWSVGFYSWVLSCRENERIIVDNQIYIHVLSLGLKPPMYQ